MKTGFLNDPADVSWLNETHLRGVTLPSKWAGFASFVLQGNEDSPNAVNLYLSADPLYSDDYYRVVFECDPPVYCTGAEYAGDANAIKNGFSTFIRGASK